MLRWILPFAMVLAVGAPLQAQVVEIDSGELPRLMAEDAVVIDIRRPDEWKRTGVIEGAHLMTFFDARGNYDLKSWMAKLTLVSTGDRKVAIVCHSGGRSRPVSRFLHESMGYRRVYDVRDGMGGWVAANRPTIPYP